MVTAQGEVSVATSPCTRVTCTLTEGPQRCVGYPVSPRQRGGRDPTQTGRSLPGQVGNLGHPPKRTAPPEVALTH